MEFDSLAIPRRALVSSDDLDRMRNSMISTKKKLGIVNLTLAIQFLLDVEAEIRALVRSFNIAAATRLVLVIAENRYLWDRKTVILAEFEDLDEAETSTIVNGLAQHINVGESLKNRLLGAFDLIPRGYQLMRKNIEFTTDVIEYTKLYRRPVDELPSPT